MTREEMREKVARAISDVRGPLYDGITLDAEKNRFRKMADAAIALIRGETLEEAARECGLSSVGLHFAAAIRALKEGDAAGLDRPPTD